jgi:hypothetical protein
MTPDESPRPSTTQIAYGVHEVVVLLGIGRDAAYQLLRQRGFRVGRRLRIGVTELAQLMAERVEREEEQP